ncbi:hypothetical protein V6N11_067409 [Hibiscus sabdariffa]|uniref:Uncharacterized protein n=1 Tax=Hibiscus sabdariffa TaxID=183260 RepID=A0ABR2SQU1_9ROSI
MWRGGLPNSAVCSIVSARKTKVERASTPVSCKQANLSKVTENSSAHSVAPSPLFQCQVLMVARCHAPKTPRSLLASSFCPVTGTSLGIGMALFIDTRDTLFPNIIDKCHAVEALGILNCLSVGNLDRLRFSFSAAPASAWGTCINPLPSYTWNLDKG